LAVVPASQLAPGPHAPLAECPAPCVPRSRLSCPSPRFVKTGLGSQQGPVVRALLGLAQRLFARRPEECASVMVDGLFGDHWRGGWRLMSASAQPAKATDSHSAGRDAVWAHTLETMERITGSRR
jgi:hypothetical protein